MLSDCRFLFNTTTDLAENTDYYFTFDYGMEKLNLFCSLQIEAKSFYFSIFSAIDVLLKV